MLYQFKLPLIVLPLCSLIYFSSPIKNKLLAYTPYKIEMTLVGENRNEFADISKLINYLPTSLGLGIKPIYFAFGKINSDRTFVNIMKLIGKIPSFEGECYFNITQSEEPVVEYTFDIPQAMLYVIYLNTNILPLNKNDIQIPNLAINFLQSSINEYIKLLDQNTETDPNTKLLEQKVLYNQINQIKIYSKKEGEEWIDQSPEETTYPPVGKLSYDLSSLPDGHYKLMMVLFNKVEKPNDIAIMGVTRCYLSEEGTNPPPPEDLKLTK